MTLVRELTDEAFVDDPSQKGPLKPFVMSHGTMAVKNMAASRRFYEEFLGLQCAQHGSTSMAVRCGIKFHVVCIQMGPHAPPAGLHNHWGMDVPTPADVDAAHEAALSVKDQYGLKLVTKPLQQHGAYSFYVEDMDSNFWEIQYYPGFQHDDIFDFGDRFLLTGEPA